MNLRKNFTVFVFLIAVPTSASASYADEKKELAKKLANPIANLISIPIQANYDENIGPDEDGSTWRINIQPVIPFTLNDDWNVITRTIVPIVSQEDVVPGSGTDTGLGPTAVALKQKDGWTYGALVNHIWTVAGDDDRPDVNATFLQPFVAFTLHTATTLTLNTESTYDWENEDWSVPVNAMVSQMLKIGRLPFQVAVGVRHWVESSTNGPDGTGFRLQLTALFPK